MTQALWRLGATEVTRAIRTGRCSALEVTQSVLARIDELNGRFNPLAEVLHDEALRAARAADQALARGDAVGALHGVPVTIKINIDTAGHATTDGVVALKDNIAASDSPQVARLREAGAVIVGRSNAPAFSLRWFTDNALHGRTLNPFRPDLTPGGSSGGAAVATALGMGAIAHGNDYGGSVRYPAWACGVVGLRSTTGRIASVKLSNPKRSISSQQMAVQGPLTRTVADARVALQEMSRPSPWDPNWVPAPLEFPDRDAPQRVALFKHHPAYPADPGVVAALEQAARWLTEAGYVVEEQEPPHFEEAAELWLRLVGDDLRHDAMAAIEALGDDAVRRSAGFMVGCALPQSHGEHLAALTRRFELARAWSVFFDRYPLLLMPVSWQRPFAIDEDTRSIERTREMLAVQSPLTTTALLGLPGLSVPTGMQDGLPGGVQLVATRFREDLLLRAGETIERAAGYAVLEALGT